MRRLFNYLLLTILTAAIPGKAFADLNVSFQYSWQETDVSNLNRLAKSVTSGWYPGYYKFHIHMSGWAGNNCQFTLSSDDGNGNTKSYYSYKVSEWYSANDYDANITGDNSVQLTFEYKHFTIPTYNGRINKNATTAKLQFDFDALRSALTPKLEELNTMIASIKTDSKKQSLTTQYNGIKNLVDKLQNNASNAQEVYNIYGQYKLWKGADANDLATRIANLKTETQKYMDNEVAYQELIKALNNASSQLKETQNTVNTMLELPDDDHTVINGLIIDSYTPLKNVAVKALTEVSNALETYGKNIETYKTQGTCEEKKSEVLDLISSQTTKMANTLNKVISRKKNVDEAISKYSELYTIITNYTNDHTFQT